MALAVAEPSGTFGRCASSQACSARGPRLRSLLAYSQSRLGVQVADLVLHLVEPAEQLQRLLRDLALVVGPQVVELASWVRQAAGFGDAGLEERLVAAVVVAHECAAPVGEERLGVTPGAAVGEVEDHRLARLERTRAVAPQVGPVRLAVARLEHRHWRLVDMQHAVAVAVRPSVRQPATAVAPRRRKPGSQRRARDRQARAAWQTAVSEWRGPMERHRRLVSGFLLLLGSIALVTGCGGGSSGDDSEQPVTLKRNSSGVTVTLKAGVIRVPDSTSVTRSSATTIELSPVQSALASGRVFTVGDSAYYATAVTNTPSGQSVEFRMATQTEAIERLEIDGDLDVEAMDLSGVAVGGAGRLDREARRHPLAAAKAETSGSCSAGRTPSAPTFDVQCSLGFTTDNGVIGGEVSIEMQGISIRKMKYSSAANPAAIAASFSAKVIGRVEFKLLPAENGEAGKSLEDQLPLGRLSLPIPGSFGFVSVRIPLGVDYKVPVPPISVGMTFTSEIVDGVGSNFVPAYFANGFEFVPSTGDVSFSIDGYSRLFSGPELAATAFPQPFFTLDPGSVGDVGVIGVYLKAGPKGKLSWKYRRSDGVNCILATEMVGEQLLTAFANTSFNDLLGKAEASYTQKLNSASLPDYAFGACMASIGPSPGSATIKVGQSLSVASFMKGYHVNGQVLPLPAGMTYFANGGAIDAATGSFSAAAPGTYYVTAESPGGLRSSALAVNVTADDSELPAYYHVAFQNIVCDTTAKVSFTATSAGSSASGGETYTPPCGPGLPSRGNIVSQDVLISLKRNTTYELVVSLESGTDYPSATLTLEIFGLNPYFLFPVQRAYVANAITVTARFATPP